MNGCKNVENIGKCHTRSMLHRQRTTATVVSHPLLSDNCSLPCMASNVITYGCEKGITALLSPQM